MLAVVAPRPLVGLENVPGVEALVVLGLLLRGVVPDLLLVGGERVPCLARALGERHLLGRMEFLALVLLCVVAAEKDEGIGRTRSPLGIYLELGFVATERSSVIVGRDVLGDVSVLGFGSGVGGDASRGGSEGGGRARGRRRRGGRV